MKYQIVNGYANKAVISFYLDIICEAIAKTGHKVEYIDSISVADKSHCIVVSHAIEVIKLRLRGYKNIVLWMQGVMPEESYMRHKNELRRRLLYVIDKLALNFAKRILMVSNEMVRFYSQKFGRDYKSKTFVMPCFSAELHPENFSEDKYRNNVFTYVGGLSRWQCFEESLRIFKKIQEEVQTARLEVYTFNPDQARALVDQYQIDDVVIETVTNDELVEKMRSIKFGFVLRKESIVNNVATPTKLSSYLASGVIPIYTDAIRDFSEIGKDMQYVVDLGNIDHIPIEDVDVSRIVNLCNGELDTNEVLKEYQALFQSYYNKEAYIDELSDFVRKIHD